MGANMKRNGLMAAAAMAILASAGVGQQAFSSQGMNASEQVSKTPISPISKQAGSNKALRQMRGGSYSGFKHSYPNGPGWGYAKVKRMALKKRNQARNRRAHRGA